MCFQITTKLRIANEDRSAFCRVIFTVTPRRKSNNKLRNID